MRRQRGTWHAARANLNESRAQGSLRNAAATAQQGRGGKHTRMIKQQMLQDQPVFLCPFTPLAAQARSLSGLPTGWQTQPLYPVPGARAPSKKFPLNVTLNSQRSLPCTKLSKSYNEVPFDPPECPYGSTLCSCKVHSSSSHFPTAFNPL